MKEMNRYYGKYRGTVVNNIDPVQMRPHPGDACPTCR